MRLPILKCELCGKETTISTKRKRFCGSQFIKNSCAYKNKIALSRIRAKKYYYDNYEREARKRLEYSRKNRK